MIKACVDMHTLIDENRRDGHTSELFDCAKDVVNRGALLVENYEEKHFSRNRREDTSSRRGHVMTEEVCDAQVLKVHSAMKDEVYHHALGLDLVEHKRARQDAIE